MRVVRVADLVRKSGSAARSLNGVAGLAGWVNARIVHSLL